jgi:hypothetical protein
MSIDTFQFGPAGDMRFARNSGRSITGDSLSAIRYPSPFFDIAHTYLPSTFKSMLRWCRYYFLTNPLINAVCYKMAEYPITDWVFDTPNDSLQQKWQYLFNTILNFKKYEIEAGLDYFAYGNSFTSISYPFRKMLQCKACKRSAPADKQKYVFRDFKFDGDCYRCGHHGTFDVYDHYLRAIKDIRLIRWNPEYITIEHNEATGETRYYYTIPPMLQNDIRMGKRHIIENIPQVFVEALRNNKAILFSKENLYHMRRPTIAQKDKGWGMPMILPVLKDTFYLQILRKAQEAIAIEHIVPMRVLYPQTTSGTADIYSTVNLSAWRDKIEQEVLRWRLDNNYIPILPIPVGLQTVGGDGRALMLSQEYRVWSEQIVAGMGVPVELIFGGMSYSGSNVSLRMLENQFLAMKSQRKQFITDFLMPSMSAYLDWEPVAVHSKKFKMADDLQRSAFFLQLNQAGKISDKSLLEDTDWDSRKEAEFIGTEQKRVLEQQRSQAVSQAAIQGEAQVVMGKYQARAQRASLALMNATQQQAGMPAPEQPAPVGQPGAMSPNTQGQMTNAQSGQANAAGMIPPVEIPPQQQAMQGAESPMNAEQQQPGYDIMAIAQQAAGWLNQLPDHEKQRELVNMQRSNPQLYSLVLQLMQQTDGAERNSSGMPLPENKPPRRGQEAASV